MSIDYPTIDKLLKKIGNFKRNKVYLNTLSDCLAFLKPLYRVLEKEYPSIKGILGEIENHICKKHHMPPLEVLSSWSRTLTEYLNYLNTNKSMIEELTIN